MEKSLERIKAADNDRIDLICWKHYGSRSGCVVELVLAANPGLAMTEMELNPAVTRITARSASFSKGTDKEKEDKEWENPTLAELAGKIAAKHSYKSQVTLEVYYESAAQTQESDLSFLKRLAEEANGSFAIRDRTILICPPDEASRPKAEIVCTESCRGSFTWADRGK